MGCGSSAPSALSEAKSAPAGEQPPNYAPPSFCADPTDSDTLRMSGDAGQLEAVSSTAASQVPRPEDGEPEESEEACRGGSLPRASVPLLEEIGEGLPELRSTADAQTLFAGSAVAAPSVSVTAAPAVACSSSPAVSSSMAAPAPVVESRTSSKLGPHDMLEAYPVEMTDASPMESAAWQSANFHMTMGNMDVESRGGDSSVGDMVIEEIEQILGEVCTPRFGPLDKGVGWAGEAGRTAEERGNFTELLAVPLQPLQRQELLNATVESSNVTASDGKDPMVGVFYTTCATVGGFGPLTADDEQLMQDILDAH